MKYRLKLNSIDELEKYNFVILNKEDLIKNNLKDILEEKGISQYDLSKLTGICRQNISQITNNKMIPGVVLASQIATVLNKKIEDIFELKENAWVKIAKINKDSTLYIDLYKLEIIENSIRKEEIDTTGLIYIDLNKNKCLTKEEFEKIKREFILEKINSNKAINKEQRNELLKEFDNSYTERFKKLGEKIIPIQIK
ncbi:MAG: helix-turn-helix domain-containing protein [Clostridiales bacterium]|nr:helix-turn-helix domain-containing protein [Clostridiales bacterium]